MGSARKNFEDSFVGSGLGYNCMGLLGRGFFAGYNEHFAEGFAGMEKVGMECFVAVGMWMIDREKADKC